ncbi:helix-turn-helix domain-containing protein [Oceanobacillus halotolerans]|uniref:helix-turn-helix domain-containing protein n=1 Tax=Oceanobacillus halotolerans TaxID=2663380 RepID=UPI0013DBC879|nr:helix-turn-helix transcriptional regulator [Oceanobacillus halotolerans]
MNGKLLKQVRIIAGFSQTELAEKIGCTQALIAYMESGRTKVQPLTEQRILQAISDKGIRQEELFLISSVLKASKSNITAAIK